MMKNFSEQLGSFGPSRSPSGQRLAKPLQSVLCITTDKYLVHVLVVLLHDCFSVVSPIPFLLAAIFFSWLSLYRKYYCTSQLC